MRVNWCQTHGRLATGNVKGDSDACPQDRAVDPCRVVPSVVIPLAEMEDLLADLRMYEAASPLAYPIWGGDRLAELIGGDDE